MGVSLETWRAGIGRHFSRVHRARRNMAAIKLGRRCIHLVVLFVYIFIVLPQHAQYTTEGGTWSCVANWLPYSIVLEPGLEEGMCSEWTLCGMSTYPGTMVMNGSQSVNCRYSTQLLLQSGDVELKPGPGKMCTDTCKHKGEEAGEMTRCCLWAAWYHEECVGITIGSETGFWLC